MILKNASAFIDGEFYLTDIQISNGKISRLGCFDGDGAGYEDCGGKYIIPGLVDIHTHGCVGFDFSSASPSEIALMQKYYLENGITSVIATTVTLSDGGIKKAVENITCAAKNNTGGAAIRGINLEGPYLSPKKCGAHDISLLKKPDLNFVNSLGDFIKIVNIAPEYDGASDFIKNFRGKASIAHTDCDYGTALDAINAGADHITHIFNAMNGLHHRNPGVIGAFFDSGAVAEIICDAVHIAPPVLRMMFNSYGSRLAVISDSMAAAGLSDGDYLLGNLGVHVENSVATLKDGTLAGSTMNIFNMMKKLISIGIRAEAAINSATAVPAASIGLNNIGRIDIGCDADLVILNKDFSIYRVITKRNS